MQSAGIEYKLYVNFMVNDFEREIILEDEPLKNLILEKSAIVEEGRKVAVELERLAKEHAVFEQKHNELWEKLTNKKTEIIARLKEVANDKIEMYEQPVTTDIKDGKIVFIVNNALGEFQASWIGFDKWSAVKPDKQK